MFVEVLVQILELRLGAVELFAGGVCAQPQQS